MTVTVRPATEGDLDTLSTILDLPGRAVHRLVHDRTTHIAERDGDPIAGLAYEYWQDTLQVTHLGGDPDGIEAILAEPRAVADRRNLTLEAIVPTDDESAVAAVEAAGFEMVGDGPAFEGGPTRRYRHRPET